MGEPFGARHAVSCSLALSAEVGDQETVSQRASNSIGRYDWAADFWSRFVFLWTLILAYRQLAFCDTTIWLPASVRVALPALIAVTLLRPRMLSAAPLFCLDLWVVSKNFPAVPNHWALTALAESILLLGWSAAALALRSEKWAIETVAKAIRYALCLIYALAAFHKLNSDFFEPSVSCAVEMAGPLDGLGAALPWLTIVGELAVSLLLAIPATRLRYGVPLGLCMHAIFALTSLPPLGIFEFSIGAMSLYWVFFVGPVAPRDESAYESFLRRLIPSCPMPSRLVLAVVFVASFAAVMVLDVRVGKQVSPYLWPAVGLLPVLLWTYGRHIGPLASIGEARATGTGSRAVALGAAAFVLLFGLSPYLGFKGVPAFSMFSNLRTETARWNHFVLPPTIKIFHFEDDAVLIHSDEGGKRGWFDPKPGMLLPYETLICLLADRATPRYADDRRVIRGTKLATSREIKAVFADGVVRVDGEKVECPLWKSKLLRFRPQTLSLHRRCSW